jgi:hypothetical protein
MIMMMMIIIIYLVYRAKKRVLCTGKQYLRSTENKISYPGELSLVYQESHFSRRR